MFGEKYGTNTINWGVDTKGFKYIKMGEVLEAFGSVQKIDGMFVNQGKYGKQGVLILADRNVLMNVPARMVDKITNIMHDDDAIKAIKSGHAGVEIYSYYPKNYPDKKCYSVNFIDM